MINGKLISTKDIIWKVYKDAGFVDEINWGDAIEWTIDALEFIYHPDNFEKKVTGHKSDPTYDITNYRAKIPCDLVHLVGVTVDGWPALPTTNTYHQLKDGGCCGVDEFASLLSNGTFVDNFGNTFITNLGTKYGGAPLTYELNNDWITLSVKEGKLCIAYLAHPTDCDGFPMVPDDVHFREAITKAIVRRLDYLKWRQNPNDRGLKALYDHSDQEYCWYIASAQNRAKMPDVDKMESIKNQMLRLKPSISEWSRNFTTLLSPESRRLK